MAENNDYKFVVIVFMRGNMAHIVKVLNCYDLNDAEKIQNTFMNNDTFAVIQPVTYCGI